MYPRGGTIPISFVLVNATDGSPITTGAVTVFLTKDNGAQATMVNTAVHKGHGQWTVAPTTTESDADVMHILAQHADAVPVNIMIVTSAKLVSDLNDFDPATQTVTPADGSITAAKIANSAITAAKIADGSITTAKVQNPDDFKADITNVAEKTDLPANFASLGINASGHISRVTLVDTTTTNTDMVGTNNALTSLGASAPANWINSAAIATNALDGKGDWNTVTPPSVDAIADQVWDEVVTGHANPGSFGLTAIQILGDTAELQADWTDGGRLDTLIDQIIADISQLNDISAADVWAAAGRTLTSATNIDTPIADAMLDRASGVETNITPRQALRLILSSAAAKLSGAGTTSVVIRDINDTKDRITATVDSDGNRTAVTTDVS